MASTFERGVLLRDISVRALDGREVYVSDFRARRNIVLLFPGDSADRLLSSLCLRSDDLAFQEAVVLLAPEAARAMYDAPSSAIFITDRFGEIFFCAREPKDALPDADAVLGWLEFINAQCPE